ncbi:CPCC family cysteine-rich protein [Roseibium sp.]|uniref:CPCC family cysteine-rich protein n=1 Tax=Roseibium sp. TaxID=1936156 RepID=UPI003A9727D8
MNSETPQAIACPCCGNLTLGTDGMAADWDICLVCFWENDPDQRKNETLAEGANDVNLKTARENYKAFGACDENAKEHVRDPLPEEVPQPEAQH